MSRTVTASAIKTHVDANYSAIGGSDLFWLTKRFLDILGSLVLTLVLLPLVIALVILNPIWNPGSLFFVQVRMGLHGRAFKVFKLRTMRAAGKGQRGHDDPLEHDRVTPLGGLLRKTRLDELPQVINVLLGQMSLIGPRPDDFAHSRKYCRLIPNYRLRHQIRPGISGLAQVELGYAEGVDATHAKVEADLEYIKSASFALDAMIFLKTIKTVSGRAGA